MRKKLWWICFIGCLFCMPFAPINPVVVFSIQLVFFIGLIILQLDKKCKPYE